MHASTLRLLLVAACMHATANLLMKQARDKLAFTWWMLTASCLLGLPLLLWMQPIGREGWLFIIASGLLETVYFVTLSRAYTHGDLSQVYPLARGSAPLFTVLWAGLFLAERPSPAGMAGILSIVLGLYLVNLPSLGDWKRPLLGFRTPAARWALLTGLLISAYATVDKRGVAYVSPLPYIYLVLFVGWVVLAPQWFSHGRRQALLDEIADSPRRRLLAASSSAMFGLAGYLLVLSALQLDPVGYVSAVREISVVIGTWMGIKILKERGGRVRVVASGLVVLGIFLIVLYGGAPAASVSASEAVATPVSAGNS